MSEIRVDTITEKTSGSGTTVSNLKNPNSPFRNIIINGDMSIVQREVTQPGIQYAGYYSCDRWRYSTGTAGLGAFTMSQSTDVPGLGFTTSTKLDNTTADASPSANEGVFLAQRIEGKNLQNIGKGTSDAKQLTLSFHVKTTKTGTYQVNLYDLDNTRIVGQTYVVSDTNWNKYTITFPADTTGAFTNDANLSLQLEFWLAAGSNYNSGAVPTSWEGGTNADRAAGLTVNLADNTSNDWYITGVQLEVGGTPTDFEHLPHDVNLQRCERYFEKSYNLSVSPGTADFDGTTLAEVIADGTTTRIKMFDSRFRVRKRAAPTMTIYSSDGGASGEINNYSSGADKTISSIGSGCETNIGRYMVMTDAGATNETYEFQYKADAEL